MVRSKHDVWDEDGKMLVDTKFYSPLARIAS